MKKIMFFIGGYIPGKKYGGPVTSIYNFTEVLGDDYDIRIVGCNHDLGDPTPFKDIHEGWNPVGKARVLYLPDRDINYENVKRIMLEEKPDMIFGNGIMYIKVNYCIIKAAKDLKIPMLMAPRGDICTNAINIKKWKKVPFLKAAKLSGIFKGLYFHSTIQEEKDNLMKYLGICPDNIFYIPEFPVAPSHKESIDKTSGKLKVVFVSRITVKKNLITAIKAVNAMTSEVYFDIYGPIEDEGYWEQCLALITKAPSNVHIQYKGMLEALSAAKVFGDYDCFIFPTLSENYGHVIAEAMMRDCPLVLSKGTTPWDDISDEEAGFTVDLSDEEGFTKALEEMASLDTEGYGKLIERLRQYIEKKINISELKREYKVMLEEVTEKK